MGQVMSRQTWLDKTILWASPQWGLRRLHARLVYEQAQKHFSEKAYDGASKGRRLSNWKTSGSSVNTETKISLPLLQQRSRDLVRNEAYATRCVNAIQANVIGEGVLAKAMAKTKGRAKIYQMEWLDWAGSTDCDADGMNNFAGIQALVVRSMVESGEVLVRRIKRTSDFGLNIPMQLQVLETDFIDSTKDGEVFSNGNFTVQGVEFNSKGQRVAYWLFDRHPGDTTGVPAIKGINSKRIPAEDILHIFRVERAGQVRGVPWMAPIMLKLKDLSDYSDFTLVRQKVSACFTAFITTPDAMDLSTGTAPKAIGEKLEPGVAEQLPPGYGIEFANPPTSGDFSQFTNAQLRAISAGIGVTYEILTNDYSQVNFSSGRMGWQEFQRNIDQWRAHLILPRLCVPVWRWFTETAAIAGYGSDKVVAIWTAPKREMIDPVKETEAAKLQVRSGFMSLSEAIRQNGYEPEEVLRERAEENKLVDSLGLVLDSDPRNDVGVKTSGAKKSNEDDSEDESKDSEDSAAQN